MTRYLLLMLTLAGLAACDNRRESGSERFDRSKGAPPTTAEPTPDGSPPTMTVSDSSGGSGSAEPSGGPQQVERQIIRSGSIDLKVVSLDTAERALQAIARANGAYTSNSTRQRLDGSTLTGSVELRLPSARFETVLSAVRRLGEIENETISTADVTQEYIDLGARLRTQQELEARILRLLQERTGKLADVIELEGKLAEIRNVIEQVQGRLRYLQNQVSYSTLTVRMTEPGAVGTSQTETFGGRVAEAFQTGIDGLVALLGGLITLTVSLFPLMVIAAVIYLLLKPRLRRRRERLRREEAERKALRDSIPETAKER